jgi:hypothetical protein
MNTNCEKCIFAKNANSEDPCAFNIINKITEYHTPIISDNNFYSIPDYRCRYGFNIEVYNQYKDSIGSIETLEEQLENKAKIRYYLIVNITDEGIVSSVCDSILSLVIKPRYVSFILHKSNSTDTIIEDIKSKLHDVVEWKIHNFLEDKTLYEAVSVVFDTNAQKNNTTYFWINNDTTHALWNNEIAQINNFIYLYQPKCSGFFRDTNKNGMFLSFSLYKQMKTHLDSDILKAFTLLENPKFIYYA